MTTFNEIKVLCNEHEECLKKNRIINNANNEQIWMEVRDAKGNNFKLEDDEIYALNRHIADKGLNIESTVQTLINKK